jgi:amino acid transporter
MAEPIKLKRSLSVWQAVGLSVALMAPSMAANINPQGAISAGRAIPLAFLIAAFGVLLVSYTFVRLCQYFHHSGSVYAFVGATLGPRAGVVAGWGPGRHVHVLRGDHRSCGRDLRHRLP